MDAIIGAEKKDGTHTPCLIDWFGDMDCRAINQDAVQAVEDQHFVKTKHGRPYKPGTIVRELIQPLSCVLNYAAAQNPPWCEKPHFVRPKFNDARSEYATREEGGRILHAASPSNRRWYLFSMLEGSRPSEPLDLDWTDVWLDRQWAVIRDTKDNSEDRGIALHPQIVEMLSRVPEKERVGKVFKTSRGLPYADAEGGRGYKTGWKATKHRAGITRDLHVHDLRHTFGTLALISGMPRRMIEEQMGHADTSMHARYVHVPRAELIEAINKLPWLEYEDIIYREWARSRFGRHVPETTTPTEGASSGPKATAAA